MSFDRTLALRLQLVTDFAAATKEAADQLQAVAKGLKSIQKYGSIKVEGLDQLGATVGKVAAGVSELEQRSKAAATAQRGMAAEAVRSSALMVQSLGQIAVGYGRVQAAADKATAAAQGFTRNMRDMGPIAGIDGIEAQFRQMGDQIALTTTRAIALEDQLGRLIGMRDLAMTPAIGTTEYVALPEGRGGSTYRAIPLSGGNSMPPPPRQAGGYTPGGPIMPYGGYQYPAVYGSGGGGGGGGGGRPPSGGGGFDFSKSGDKMIGAGFSGLMAGGMGAYIFDGMLNNASDLNDLLLRISSVMQTTPQLAQQFNDSLLAATLKIPVPTKEAAAGGYTFVSGLPADFNINSKAGMAAAQEMFRNILKLSFIGGSSAAPFSASEAAFDENTAFVQHFNLSDALDPKKLKADYQKIGDTFTNLENTTSTTIPQIGQAFKAMGPIAEQMGMTFDDTAGFIGILAHGGVRGSSAGYSGKRILMRQSAPSGSLEKLEKLLSAHGYNGSLFQGGNTRDFYKWLESVNSAEKHMDPQNKAFVNAKLGGLYAVSQLDQLLNFVDKQGGAAGVHKYIGGLTKSGSLNKVYTDRMRGNVKAKQITTGNELQVAEVGALKAATPDILAVLNVITKMLGAFNSMPAPMKRFIVDIGMLATGGLLAAGAFNLFLGSILKLVGNIGEVVKIAGAFKDWGGIARIVEGVVGWFGRLAGIGEVLGTAAEVVGGAAAAIVTTVGAIPLAIAAIIAGIALFGLAWAKDWGGIREKTAAAMGAIGNEFKKLPEQLGWLAGRFVAFEEEMAIKWIQFWLDLPKNAVNSVSMTGEAIGKFFTQVLPKWVDGGVKWVEGLGSGIASAFPKLIANIGNYFSKLPGEAMKAIGDMTHAGQTAAKQFGKGFQQGADSQKPTVDAALANLLGNKVPHSPVRDKNSPIADLYGSGVVAAQQFGSGFYDGTEAMIPHLQGALGDLNDAVTGFRNGDKAGKKKKGRATPNDLAIDIKKASVQSVEQAIPAIEAEMDRFHDVVKKKWIELWKNDNQVGRVFADPNAVRMAVRNNPKDQSAAHASDWLRNNNLPAIDPAQRMTQLSGQIAKLHQFWQQATDAHNKAMIQGMINSLTKQYDQLAKGLEAKFYGKDGNNDNVTGGMIGQLNKEFSKINDQDQKFNQTNDTYNRLIQQRVELRKNKDLPTLQELIKERNLEENQLKALQKIYKDEENERTTINEKVKTLTDQIAKLNDNDATQHALKQQLLAQMADYKVQLDTINTDLDTQQQDLKNVNSAIRDNTQAMTEATSASSAWERAVVSATEKAGKAAITHLADTFSANIDKMLEEVFGKWKGKGVSGSLKSAIGDFFATFISELLNSAVNNLMKYAESTLTDFFKSMVTKFSGGGSGGSGSNVVGGDSALSAATGGMTQIGVDSSGNPIFAAASAAGGSGGNSFSNMLSNSILGKMWNGKGMWGDKTLGGKGTLGSLGIGLASGALFGQLMGGGSHSTWGEVGGTIGSFFGPLGGAAGGFIGSLFGHADNQAAMPDKYNTASWGQENADLWGATASRQMHANGQSFTENSQLASQLGGKGMLQYIAAWISTNPKDAEKVLGKENVKLFSGLNLSTPVVGGKDGNLNLANGQTMQYDALYKAAQQAITSITGMAGAADQAATDAQRMADSFASMVWGAPSGFTMPDYLGGGGAVSGPGFPRHTGPLPVAPGDGLPHGLLPLPRSVPKTPISWVPGGSNVDPVKGTVGSVGGDINLDLHLLEGAQVSNAQLFDEIVALIPQLKGVLTNAVNERMYRNARLRGDEVSAI